MHFPLPLHFPASNLQGYSQKVHENRYLKQFIISVTVHDTSDMLQIAELIKRSENNPPVIVWAKLAKEQDFFSGCSYC